MKLTKQGIRDLGGGHRQARAPLAGCSHLFELKDKWDCWTERFVDYRQCSFCHEVE